MGNDCNGLWRQPGQLMSDSSDLRVLHLRTSQGIGGPERVIQAAWPYLQQSGITPGLIVYQRPGTTPSPLITVVAGQDCPVTVAPAGRSLLVEAVLWSSAVHHLVRQVQQGQYQVLHSHDYRSNWLAIMAAKRTGVKTVATVHGYTRENWKLRLYERCDAWVLRHIDKIIVVSALLRDQLVDRGISRQQLTVIPPGLALATLDRAVAAARREEFALPAGPIVTFVGRLVPGKGVDLLLRAGQQLLARNKPVTFVIVGDGPARRHLEVLADGLGLAGSVHFLGQRDDAVRIMAVSDLVVLPSRHEGSPLVMLEAMAVGQPVVATDVGGIAAMMTDGVTGRLVTPNDVSALAGGIESALSEHEATARMAEQACQDIRQQYDAARLTKQWVRIYRNLVADQTDRLAGRCDRR